MTRRGRSVGLGSSRRLLPHWLRTTLVMIHSRARVSSSSSSTQQKRTQTQTQTQTHQLMIAAQSAAYGCGGAIDAATLRALTRQKVEEHARKAEMAYVRKQE